MKKLLISVPFAIGAVGAVAFAATSQIAGEQTQKEYQRLLEQLGSLSGASFVNESYESGVTRSTAVTKVLVSDTDDANLLFLLHHDIDHSAISKGDDGLQMGTVTITTTLHEQDLIPEEALEMFTDSTPFRLVSDIEHTGDMRNQITVSSIKSDQSGVGLEWDGLEFDVVTKGDNSVGRGTLGKLSVRDPQEGLDISFAESPFDMDITVHDIVKYTGSANFAVNQLSLYAPGRPAANIERLSIESESKINDDALDSSVLFDIDGIETLIPLNSASLDVDVNGLGLEGVAKMNEFLQSLQGDVDEDQLQSQMMDISRNLFLPGSLMNYDLVLTNEGGDVVADLNVAIKEEGEDGMSADALEKIVTQRDLLNILNLEGSLNADTSALALTPVMIFLGAAGDFITVTDESVTSSVSLDGSTLNVNGVILELDQMVGTLDIPLVDLLGR